MQIYCHSSVMFRQMIIRNSPFDAGAFRTMLDELCSLIRKEKLTAPVCAEVGLPDYSKALNAALQPFVSAKQVLIM